MKTCPCGSNQKYEDCCKKFITGDLIPDTAVLLMRSRYTAYTLENIDYIMDTHNPDTLSNISKDILEDWSKSSKWIKLELISEENINENETIVEFKAFYELKTMKYIHHEKSVFIKKEKRWYYSDSIPLDQTITKNIKIGRNDPCSCGSGKKYKKCCG